MATVALLTMDFMLPEFGYINTHDHTEYLLFKRGNLNICSGRGGNDEEGHQNSGIFIVPRAVCHGAGQFHAYPGAA